MRVDTPYGPVWLYPDTLHRKVAMQGARLELAWPDLNGFSAMHTGSGDEGAWVVRAPRAALEQAGYRSDSAAEYPVKEGTVWPPTHIKFIIRPSDNARTALQPGQAQTILGQTGVETRQRDRTVAPMVRPTRRKEVNR
jgi:hypothetical protein